MLDSCELVLSHNLGVNGVRDDAGVDTSDASWVVVTVTLMLSMYVMIATR